MITKEYLDKALALATDTKVFEMSDGALARVPAVFKDCFPGKKAIIIADCNTWKAAGEAVQTETTAFTHWFCRAYDKYADNEASLPFDQHFLLACVAPRPLLVCGFDKDWFDTKGEFLSVRAASPVWELLGKPGLPDVSWPDDFDTKAIGPCVGYVRRSGAHFISYYDWKWILDFANANFQPASSL